MVDMAHIAGLVAAGFHPSPHDLGRLYDDDDPQDPARTARRHDPDRKGQGEHNRRRGAKSGRAKQWSEVLDGMIMPGIQGGPLMHVIAGKAVALKEALEPSFKDYIRQVVANAKTLSTCPRGGRSPDRVRRHRQPPHARRPFAPGHHGQGSGNLAGRREHHRQQERHTLRPEESLHHLGNSRRKPRRHHPRHEGTRDAADRRASSWRFSSPRARSASLKAVGEKVLGLTKRFRAPAEE